MKLFPILKAGVVAALFAATGIASAQTLTRDVALTVTLTSQCQLKAADPDPTLAFPAYTAFQAGASTAPTQPITFECTRGYGAAPTLTWDGATANGVIAGLQYTLTASAAAGSAGTAPTALALGTAATTVITVGGSIPGGQAGTNTAGQATATRTLTVAF